MGRRRSPSRQQSRVVKRRLRRPTAEFLSAIEEERQGALELHEGAAQFEAALIRHGFGPHAAAVRRHAERAAERANRASGIPFLVSSFSDMAISLFGYTIASDVPEAHRAAMLARMFRVPGAAAAVARIDAATLRWKQDPSFTGRELT